MLRKRESKDEVYEKNEGNVWNPDVEFSPFIKNMWLVMKGINKSQFTRIQFVAIGNILLAGLMIGISLLSHATKFENLTTEFLLDNATYSHKSPFGFSSASAIYMVSSYPRISTGPLSSTVG